MKINATLKTSVKILYAISECQSDSMAAEQIAIQISQSLEWTYKVCGKLKVSGILRATPGRTGGYVIIPDVLSLTLGDLISKETEKDVVSNYILQTIKDIKIVDLFLEIRKEINGLSTRNIEV